MTRTNWKATLPRAIRLLESGLSAQLTADACETTAAALDAALRRAGTNVGAIRAAARPAVWTVSAFAEVLGVPEATVHLWVRRGWLATYRTKPERPGRPARDTRRHGSHQIDRAAALDFLRERRAWMTYETAAIRDADLRKAADVFRTATPGRWWKAKDIAVALHYSVTTAARWSRESAWLDGWEREMVWKTWWVWVPQGCALPEPPRARPYLHPRALPERNAAVCAAFDAGESPYALAEQYGVHPVQIWKIARERKLSGMVQR